jgi:hypothetical protein
LSKLEIQIENMQWVGFRSSSYRDA